MNMGFETIIVSAIAIFFIILVTIVFITGTNALLETTHKSFKDLERDLLEKIMTKVSIANLAWDNTSGDVTVYISNDGSTKIVEYNHMDIILIHNGTAKYLDYPSDWQILGIENDTINPDILDPGETLKIIVNGPFSENDTVKFIISTPNGVVYSSKTFIIGG